MLLDIACGRERKFAFPADIPFCLPAPFAAIEQKAYYDPYANERRPGMPAKKIVIIANFLQGCVPLLALFAYLPQWRKIIANKSSKDISLTSWLVWLLSSAIAIFYAVIQYQVTGKGTALIFSSVLTIVFVFVTVCLIAFFRKGDRSRA
jgi:uncharacterized protein with PQ loop repeat